MVSPAPGRNEDGAILLLRRFMGHPVRRDCKRPGFTYHRPASVPEVSSHGRICAAIPRYRESIGRARVKSIGRYFGTGPISALILGGYLFVVVLTAGLGVYVLSSMARLHQITDDLFEHPYTVRVSASELRSEIVGLLNFEWAKRHGG
jgi:hypothetical protein